MPRIKENILVSSLLADSKVKKKIRKWGTTRVTTHVLKLSVSPYVPYLHNKAICCW